MFQKREVYGGGGIMGVESFIGGGELWGWRALWGRFMGGCVTEWNVKKEE